MGAPELAEWVAGYKLILLFDSFVSIESISLVDSSLVLLSLSLRYESE